MNKEREGFLLGLAGVVIFGLTLPATRIAVRELDPVFVGLGRGVLAALIAGLILYLAKQPFPASRLWRPLLITAGGVVLGFPLFATIAMQYAPASHGGVVLAFLPLATAMAAVLLAGEHPSPVFWFWGIAGALSVLAYALYKGAGNTALQLADLLLLAATISAAIGYAAGGRLSRELGGWQVICWALVFALPLLLPIVWYFADVINWRASPAAWSGFFYVALMSQLIGFFAWNKGLALGGVAKVGQVQLLQPFVTLIASVLLLRETVTWLEAAFALLVVAIVAFGRRTQVGRR